MEYTVNLPNTVNITKNKKFSLNLNQYRNAHFFTLSKAKKEFEKIVSPLLINLPKFEECSLVYIFYPKNRAQASDLGNVCPIVGKFFEDTLVNCGHLPDDSPEYIKNISYIFGGFDKDNPRTTVIIKGKPMINISLSQVEIKKAIIKYISTIYLPQLDENVDVVFDTQKKDGIIASIVINSDEESPEVKQKPVVRRTRKPHIVTQQDNTQESKDNATNEDSSAVEVNTNNETALFSSGSNTEPELDLDKTELTPSDTEETTESSGLFSELIKP